MRYLLFFLFFLFKFSLFALEGNFQFKGVLILNSKKKDFVSYVLNIQVNKNVVKGFAITDPGGKHETKNEITGIVDRQKKSIQISERKIVYTKSNEPRASFCYVSLTGKYKEKKESVEISGDFDSKYANMEPCLSGTFQLISIKRLERLIQKGDKKIQKDKSLPDSIKQKYDLASIFDSLSTNYLRNDDVIKLFIKSNEVELTIFDHDKEDGDQISVTVNEKNLLPSVLLESRKKVYKIQIEQDANIIKILALNEGKSPPNTGTLIFKEMGIDTEMILRSYLRTGEKAEIVVIKSND
jgi:hypothetical protein